MIKKIIVLFFCMSAVSAIHSQVTAIACLQSKTDAENSAEIVSYFENIILERFFDSGFVVTDIPVITGGKELFENTGHIREAFEAEPDYLLVLYFSYKDGKIYDEVKKKIYPEWESVSCKIIKTDSEKILYKEDFYIEKTKDINYLKKAETLAADICGKAVKKIRRNK